MSYHNELQNIKKPAGSPAPLYEGRAAGAQEGRLETEDDGPRRTALPNDVPLLPVLAPVGRLCRGAIAFLADVLCAPGPWAWLTLEQQQDMCWLAGVGR